MISRNVSSRASDILVSYREQEQFNLIFRCPTLIKCLSAPVVLKHDSCLSNCLRWYFCLCLSPLNINMNTKLIDSSCRLDGYSEKFCPVDLYIFNIKLSLISVLDYLCNLLVPRLDYITVGDNTSRWSERWSFMDKVRLWRLKFRLELRKHGI